MMKRFLKFFRGFLKFGLGPLLTAAVFLWIAAGEIYDYTDSFNLDSDAVLIDVVVCPAGGRGRIAAAVQEWERIRAVRENKGLGAPVLFFSGVGPHTTFESLTEVSGTVPQDRVVLENVSENTFENAQIFAAFARQKSWKKILLMTAGYHLRRSEFIFRKGLDPDTILLTKTIEPGPFTRNGWRQSTYSIRVTLIEYSKWLFYRSSY